MGKSPGWGERGRWACSGWMDSVAPSGACCVPRTVPRLTPWATFCRPSGPWAGGGLGRNPPQRRGGVLGARGLRSYSYSYSGRWEQGEVMRGGCGSSTSTALRAEYEYEYERRGGRGHWGQICSFDRSKTGQCSEWICCPTCPRPMVLGRGRYRRRGDVPVFFYRCGSNLVLAIRGSGPQAWEMLLMDPPSCGGTRVGAGSRPAAPA